METDSSNIVESQTMLTIAQLVEKMQMQFIIHQIESLHYQYIWGWLSMQKQGKKILYINCTV